MFIKEIGLHESVPSDSYLAELPVVKNLQRMGSLTFRKPVTFFVGENGIGKSTLIEAIAVSMGFATSKISSRANFSPMVSLGIFSPP